MIYVILSLYSVTLSLKVIASLLWLCPIKISGLNIPHSPMATKMTILASGIRRNFPLNSIKPILKIRQSKECWLLEPWQHWWHGCHLGNLSVSISNHENLWIFMECITPTSNNNTNDDSVLILFFLPKITTPFPDIVWIICTSGKSGIYLHIYMV